MSKPSKDRFWRTVVRIVAVDEAEIHFKLPAWSEASVLTWSRLAVPEHIQPALAPNLRLHAYANIGVATVDELDVKDWEWDGHSVEEQAEAIAKAQESIIQRPRTFWDRMEEAGHAMTLVSGPVAGEYSYYCERCGSFVLTNSAADSVIFHAPPGIPSTQDSCAHRSLNIRSEDLLYTKLKKNRDETFERLRRI